MSDYTSRAIAAKQQILTDRCQSPSSSSSETRLVDHADMVKHVFDNLSTLRTVLDNDKALSTMLYDMIYAQAGRQIVPPYGGFDGPQVREARRAAARAREARPKWGDED